MEDYPKRSESFNVAITELEHFLPSQGDEAVTILCCACDDGGRKKFAELWTERGAEVAEIRRFVNALQSNQDRNYIELQDALEYMKGTRNGFLDTMERK